MYRCKDCGLEYKDKVEYCECGNNTFDIVPESGKKMQVNSALTNANKISWIIFALCVLLSFAFFIFIPTPDKSQKTHTTKVLTPKTTIPDIDKLWDDTPVKIPDVKQEQNEQVQNTEPQGKIKIEEPKFISEIFNTSPAKTKTAPVKKVETKPVKNTKPVQVQNPKPKVTSPKTEVVKKNETVKKVNPTPVKKTDTVKKTNTAQNFNPAPITLKPEKTDNLNPAFMQYKTELLHKLFSRFVVSSVKGSGSCIVSFNIASDGKLTNRKFVKQSENKTLNDAVYYMLMSVPKFNPPPSAYKGGTLKIQFKFDNGEYEFSYL